MPSEGRWEEGAELREGAGVEGTGTGQRRAGVGWGRTLFCSSPCLLQSCP